MTEVKNVSIDSVIENLITIQPLLSKTFTRSLRAKTNLNPGSLYVLGVLLRHETLSMSEIGCKLSMPKPHVTSLVDKLIAEEMVERLNDPNDRRIINIQITDKGKNDFLEIKKEISKEFRLKLKVLNPDQLRAFSTASKQVKDILTEILVEQNSINSSCKIV